MRGDLEKAVQQLKWESGKGLFMGDVKLPLALAELGLIALHGAPEKQGNNRAAFVAVLGT